MYSIDCQQSCISVLLLLAGIMNWGGLKTLPPPPSQLSSLSLIRIILALHSITQYRDQRFNSRCCSKIIDIFPVRIEYSLYMYIPLFLGERGVQLCLAGQNVELLGHYCQNSIWIIDQIEKEFRCIQLAPWNQIHERGKYILLNSKFHENFSGYSKLIVFLF